MTSSPCSLLSVTGEMSAIIDKQNKLITKLVNENVKQESLLSALMAEHWGGPDETN